MGLSPLGALIFADRYAKRTPLADVSDLSLCEGRACTVALDQKVVSGTIVSASGDEVVVRSAEGDRTVRPELVSVVTETFADAKRRMAYAVGATDQDREAFHRYLFGTGDELPKYVPAGRIWSSAGLVEQLTPYNCFVLPTPHDSRKGIFERLSQWAEIMSRGGGVGITLQGLRPRRTRVRGVNGYASGPVSWAELFSRTTGLIEQGGSRRGAAMLMLADWHPDICEFITAKRNPQVLTNANVSVAITDSLMAAVASDGEWQLRYPHTDHSAYDTEWDGDLAKWEAKGYPVRVYRTMRARELWELIVESAWASAEPGIVFIERYNKESNSYYYERGVIYATNPCAEQGIPPWAVCNLGHLNLPRFLLGDGMHAPAQLDWDALDEAVRLGVRFQDAIIDIAYAPLPENEVQQKGERRIGLGTLGLGELLIRLHIQYGDNPTCLEFLDKLYERIACVAYMASADLAAEKGSFPWYDADKFLESGFCKRLPEPVRDYIRARGMRNVTVLTQAPTGTVGTMLGTSTGIEPYFSWGWERTGQFGSAIEGCNVYQEYMEACPDVAALRAALPVSEQCAGGTHLPSWFVNAQMMSPADHGKTQAVIQRWVDSSISKTSNVPNHFTPAQVGEYYEMLYALGAKGGTVYRDGSRSAQVLTVGTKAETPAPAQAEVGETELAPPLVEPHSLQGLRIATPAGNLHAMLAYKDQDPYEVWLNVSRAGSATAAHCEGLARLTSLALRLPSPLSRRARLALVVEQLAGIGGGDATGFGPNRVLSLPDGVARALSQLSGGAPELPTPAPSIPPGAPTSARGVDLCPECGAQSLIREEGCTKCTSCGYSKC